MQLYRVCWSGAFASFPRGLVQLIHNLPTIEGFATKHRFRCLSTQRRNFLSSYCSRRGSAASQLCWPSSPTSIQTPWGWGTNYFTAIYVGFIFNLLLGDCQDYSDVGLGTLALYPGEGWQLPTHLLPAPPLQDVVAFSCVVLSVAMLGLVSSSHQYQSSCVSELP